MTAIRHDWRLEEALALYRAPFNDLLYQAHGFHRRHHDPNKIQLSRILSIKTGACPEDCSYCGQSARHKKAELVIEKLLPVEQVVEAAKRAKKQGATRFCMGGAWRTPPKKAFLQILEIVKAVKQLGLETCITIGMLTQEQVSALDDAGLDYYNHNLDTSPEYYDKIITTRTYQDRLDTLEKIRQSKNIKVCCGGIIGMGEKIEDRVSLLVQLANLPSHPESVPINALARTKGTPLEHAESINPIEFVKIIALARIMMPKAMVRLSAGRTEMSNEMQALCFYAGANSIFYNESGKIFLTPNPGHHKDLTLLNELGIEPMTVEDGVSI